MPKVTVIIPALNEEKTIRNVIQQAKRNELVDEIIVVDDFSLDNTVAEAKKEEVKKEAPPKPVMYRAGGIVLAVDAKAAKITLEQREVKLQRKLTLKVGKKESQQLAGINTGDVVDVWVTGSTVTKLVKVF